ncbi:DUF4917 family protein [Desulfovibrio falkowii]|uniref:DUF4917 family protein n=1 Tax=Desulfovibrio sp. WGS1351 TaxID=3366814 RepID=UPI00372D2BA6
MKTFDELIELTQDSGPRNLLLGNGYSIAASSNFNYQNLLEKTDFTSSPWIRNLFSKYSTCNFEFILEVLRHAENVNEEIVGSARGENQPTLAYQVDVIHHARIVLIRDFIQTLRDIHPDNNYRGRSYGGVTGDMFIKNREFLTHFTKRKPLENSPQIFTLNYDLLLYWALLNSGFNIGDNFAFCDNFSYGANNIFNNGFLKSTNLWYLHGALHLRTDDFTGETKKLVYTEKSRILDNLSDDLINSRYPTIVFEGTTAEKKSRIGSNMYLSTAYNSLCSVNGTLFTYGVSFNENDQHIGEAISKSGISALCVGIFGSEQENPLICGNCEMIKKWANINRSQQLFSSPLEVYYYDTSQMSIW